MRRLAEDDIQMVRAWRNAAHVTSSMFYQSEISFSEQRAWFRELDEAKDFHYVYSAAHIDVGLVSVTNFDPVTRTADGGIFCGVSEFLGHPLNIWALVTHYRWAFDELGVRKICAQIREDNRVAVRMNKTLGFVRSEDQGKCSVWELDRGEFLERTKAWRFDADEV